MNTPNPDRPRIAFETTGGDTSPGRETESESEVGKTIRGVVFEKQDVVKKGKIIAKTFRVEGTEEHKIIFLDPKWQYDIQPGVEYDVEVVFDTVPGKRKGKLFVKIVGEEGVPIQYEKQREVPLPIDIDKQKGMVLVLDSEIPFNVEGGTLVPDRKKFEHFTLDEHTLRILHKVATAVELDKPLLLEGDTAATKTSAIEFLASITNNQVRRLNLDGQSDTSALIGKFVPNDGKIALEFQKLLDYSDSLKPRSKTIIDKAQKEGRELSKMEAQMIATDEGIQVAEWRWQDGAVPQAMKNGEWLILDEMTFADPSVRERLNSVLERSKSLVLSENGGEKIGENGDFELDNRFRIFATTNPSDFGGRIPLTPAEARRWSSYMYVESPPKESFIAMMNYMAFGESPVVEIKGQKYKADDKTPSHDKLSRIPKFKQIMEVLAAFHVELAKMAKQRVIGRDRKTPYIFTRDNLLNLMDFLQNKTILDRRSGVRKDVKQVPKQIIERAIDESYLDFIVGKDDTKKVKDVLTEIGFYSLL